MTTAPRPQLSKHESDKVVDTSRQLEKKRNAGPSWDFYTSNFGEKGARRNADSKIVGYKMPRTKDPVKNRKRSEMVYEAWGPHRKVAIEMGGNHNASIHNTTLVNRKTGERAVVPSAGAKKKALASGMVEPANYKGAPIRNGMMGDMLWKWAGGWIPTGVRTLGARLDGGSSICSAETQVDPSGRQWNIIDGEWVRD